MFISFEGIDGCGKSTQVKILNEYFISKNIKTLLIREPGGTLLSEKIREILLSKSFEITDISELMLFSAARNNLVATVIEPAINNGIVVICDRFYDSTVAYQGYGRGLDIQKVKLINDIAINGIKPDITFYLKLPIDIANQRANKRKSRDRIEQSGNQFFEKVIEGYDTIANEEPERVKIISAIGSISHIHSLIVDYIKKIH